MVYEMLRKEVIANTAKRTLETFSDIDNANDDFCLRHYSTNARWDQYQNGTITRGKAADYAKKRIEKKFSKSLQEDLEKIEECEKAKLPETISILVEWRRSSVWGYNPYAEVADDKKRYFGSASGCGYDKFSAAVANCFNQSLQIKKILYNKKEEALKTGKTGNNSEIIGYGSGYDVLPEFKGGVGMSCFVRILQDAGYKYKYSGGNKIESYFFYK